MDNEERNSENLENNLNSELEEIKDGPFENLDSNKQSKKTYKEIPEEGSEDIQQEDEENTSQGNETCGEESGPSQEIPPHKKNGSKSRQKIRRGQNRCNSSFGVGFIALTVALAVMVTGLFSVVGVFAVDGLMWIGRTAFTLGSALLSDQPTEDNVNIPADDMNVIKNDGSIIVNEQVGSTGNDANMTVAEVVELVADTVVEITTSHVVNDRFYGQYVTSGAGSGVIITENGYIITNYHVVEGAREITVRLNDGKEYEARVIGGDPSRDIAVVKINASGLAFAVMGSSKDLVVGQDVIAIGNPLGSLGGTVTDGIISALDRNVVVDGRQMTLMQTNAAINPGNSGGGLFDMAGQLIGIVNAKQSDTGIEGLGFAIPIDVAWDAVKDIVEGAT